jgi:hypothetical protein
MAKVFIGYRRADSQGFAGRLADDLAESLGDEHVFRDIEITPGQDFAEVLRTAISSAALLIPVIGPEWLAPRSPGESPRLFEEHDWVRGEIEMALADRVPLLPVLVGGATMPPSDALPESIQSLSRVQAHTMSDRTWDHDLERLISLITRQIPSIKPPKPEPEPPTPRRRASRRHVWRRVGRGTARGTAWVVKRGFMLVLMGSLAYFVLENYAGAGVRQFVYGFFAFLRDTVLGLFA